MDVRFCNFLLETIPSCTLTYISVRFGTYQYIFVQNIPIVIKTYGNVPNHEKLQYSVLELNLDVLLSIPFWNIPNRVPV